jgi:hypothetical protein
VPRVHSRTLGRCRVDASGVDRIGAEWTGLTSDGVEWMGVPFACPGVEWVEAGCV